MFRHVTDTFENEWIFRNILQYYTLELNPESHEGIKENIFKDLSRRNPDFHWRENFPESFEAAVDTYLQQPITDEERTAFMASFRVPFMSTGKSVQQLFSINPEGMTPTLDELIKSKRIQTLVYDSQGNILGQLLNEINQPMPFYKKFVTPETQELYKDRLKVKRLEVRNMYQPQEEAIAVAWVAAVEAHPEFTANVERHELAAAGVRERNQNKHVRLPNVTSNILEAFQKMTLEKAAGGANKGGRRRQKRRDTKRRKSKRKQTRRK